MANANSRSTIISVLIGLAALAVTSPAIGSVMYTVTDLGTLGGTSSEAFGINNLGEVVGDANLPGDGVAHAFLYSGGVMHDLGTLGGTFNQAAAINDLGQVVGEAMIAGGAYHAFIYSNGTMQDLGTLGGTQSGASGINNASTVVGYSYTDSSPLDACGFTSNNGGPMVSTGGFTGVAINSSGDVTGTMLPYAGATAAHGYVFPSDGSAYDIGTLGGAYCSPEAINNMDWVVGISKTAGGALHAFAYANGAIADLGTFGGASSFALGINDSGEVVGGANLPSGISHAFISGVAGQMQDLNSLIDPQSGWTLYKAADINDAGQIVGIGRDPEGQSHAYLLTPVDAPEPGTGALLATGICLLALARRAGEKKNKRSKPR